ncbi:MAG: DUF2778 domain-containing protein [Pseudolabrys sp.]
MTDATAAFYAVPHFDGRVFSFRACRRAIRPIANFVAVSLAAVGTVGLLIATVTFAAAWIVDIVVATNPIIHASAPAGPGALALVQDDSNLAGAPAVTFSDRWARATASMQARAVPLATPQTQVAELTPAAAPAPVTALPLPPKRPTERANSVPLPRPYPAQRDLAVATVHQIGAQVASQVAAVIASPPPAEKRAAPLKEAHNKPAALPAPDSRTAVYDIAAHTVYLPNGERLEAHSGLGDKLDDPRYVNVRMRGPTPPNVYDLTLREEIFHGVRAIRLNPVDDDKMFGRAGMLAHTYMLGPNGQSNGCVSFRDYDKFLHAFLKGEVERLVVVAHRDGAPSRVAHERRGHPERYAANN